MKKLVALLTTAVMLVALAVPAMAEKYDANTPIKEATGTTTTFDKYLVMKKDAQVPYADFIFVVSSDGATGTPATNEANEEMYPVVLIAPTTSTPRDVTPVVWKGVRPDKVVVTTKAADTDELTGTALTALQADYSWITYASVNVGEITFTPADETAAANGPFRDGVGDIATASEKYVKKSINLSFTDIKFAEPGVYRYYVEERNGATYGDLGITYDVNANNSRWRTLDVYVGDKDTRDYTTATGDGELEVIGYVWYEGKLATTAAPSHTADKGAWAVDWTDTSKTPNEKYVYVSNNEWNVMIPDTQNAGQWVKIGEAKEPPAAATGSVDINGTTYTTFGAAKAAMETAPYTPNGAEAGNKSSEYVNKYGTQDLEFGKKVIGNQGSRDQWFEFTVTLEDASLEPGTEFPVNIGAYTGTNPANADHFFAPTANAATSHTVDDMRAANADAGAPKKAAFTAAKNTTDENILVVPAKANATDPGKLEWKIYLQHGQYVQIKGIPNGVTYTVEETDAATGYIKADGTDIAVGVIDGEEITNAHMDPWSGIIGSKATKTYVKNPAGDFYKNGDAFAALYTNPADGKVYTEDTYTNEWTGDRYFQDENVYTGVTNKRSGVIPTGVAMGLGGAALLLGLVVVYLVIRRRSASLYEEE